MTNNKILIVDDDKDLLYGMNVWLKSQGYKVVFATDATTAIIMTQSEKPDLIILDLSLPGGGGYHVMKSLRSALPHTTYIPVIVITAGDASINQERALKAGAEAFFQKPVDNRQLLVAIKAALEAVSLDKDGEETPKKKILIIDDDRDLLEGLKVRLKSYGFDVFFAMDSTSSVGIALKLKPDLIILDVSLPGGDGYQTMTRLRSLMPLAHIPIIIITAAESSIHQGRALKAGAEAFFQKPIDNRQLFVAIKKALGESEDLLQTN
jgi:DNA-binding response OmpR family regulator